MTSLANILTSGGNAHCKKLRDIYTGEQSQMQTRGTKIPKN